MEEKSIKREHLEKIKHIIVIIVIVFAVIVSLYEIGTNLINNNESIAYIEETKWKEDYYDENGEYHHVYEMVIDSDDGKSAYDKDIACILLNEEREKWVDVPLSKEFLKKYENRKILDDDNIIKFSWSDGYHKLLLNDELSLDEKLITRLIECEKTDGDYSYVYNLVIDKNKRIKDIEILSIKKLYDVNTGYTDEYYIKFNENTYLNLFRAILFPSYTKEHQGDIEIDRHNVALSQNFIDKYGYDDDIVKYDTPLSLNSIYIDESRSNFKDRVLSFSINLKYENKSIDYKYKFVLDKHNFLDDIELIDSKEFMAENLPKLKYDEQIFEQVVIKNSNWRICPLSEKFLNNYSNSDSLFKDYNFHTVDYVKKMDKSKYNVIEHQYIRILNKGQADEHICVFRVVWNNNNEVDDILTYIVPDDMMNLSYEEMYELAFNN